MWKQIPLAEWPRQYLCNWKLIISGLEAISSNQVMSIHMNTDSDRQTPHFHSLRRARTSHPNQIREGCSEECGEYCTSQAKPEDGLHHMSSSAGRWRCACTSRGLSSPRRCSWSGCSSLCNGTSTGCRCLHSSRGNSRVWYGRRDHHGCRRGQGGLRDLNQRWVDRSDGDNRWLGGDRQRLRCCRSGDGQRLGGDDSRLASDDTKGVCLARENRQES